MVDPLRTRYIDPPGTLVDDIVRTLPFFLFCVVPYAALGRGWVEVSDSTLKVVNPLRTYVLDRSTLGEVRLGTWFVSVGYPGGRLKLYPLQVSLFQVMTKSGPGLELMHVLTHTDTPGRHRDPANVGSERAASPPPAPVEPQISWTRPDWVLWTTLAIWIAYVVSTMIRSAAQ